MPHQGPGSSLELTLAPGTILALVGPSGSGKSTFARAHFRPTEVLSSDLCRKLVADDENDQTATPQAFAVLYFIAARRMRRGRVTVVDSTNVRRADRQRVLWLAARYHRPAAAILFASPLEVCIAQNRARTERQVDPEAIRLQWERMPRSGAELAQEGFQATLVLRSSADAGSAVVTRAGPD